MHIPPGTTCRSGQGDRGDLRMQRTPIMFGVKCLIGACIAALASAGASAQETRETATNRDPGRHGDAHRKVRVRHSGGDRRRERRRIARAQSQTWTYPKGSAVSPASSCKIATTMPRICRSPRVASARAPPSACAACVYFRTTYRSPCPMGRVRRLSSISMGPTASRSCAVRSPLFMATPRVA